MSLIETIDKDIKNAMLAREKEKLEALRAVKNALLVQRTEKGSAEIDRDTEIKLLQRLVKQRKEAAELFTGQGRADLTEVEMFQAGIIEAYLPQKLSPEEIKATLTRIISETGAKDIKDLGRVMGKATKELAGKADNKQVADLVKELLS